MKKWLILLSRIEIVLIFLVIIAGSVVRMSGSGMGCPDWPKCFGHLIPPTERAQLDWKPETDFKKKQIIIKDEALYYAREGFTSSSSFNDENWAKYTKHDYALFNPVHTWIEYINRLLGALSGLPMLALVFLSVFLFRENWRYLVLSAAGLFMLGFEAWLGKLVVDGNLIPGSITIHMIGALLILAILLLLNAILERESKPDAGFTAKFKFLSTISIFATLIQVGLGTQVRETVDHLQQMGMARNQWMDNMDLVFYIHRSFSILVIGLNFWLWKQNKNLKLGYWQWNYILVILALEVLAGIILAYFNLPYFAQPLHLLLGSILFGLQIQALFYLHLHGEKRIIPIK
ncbi:MAG: COX15/CtaA family protein [Bacteroidetes bacterium]|nr:COX15/CtaA family protein [Bacteroidota bacterium]